MINSPLNTLHKLLRTRLNRDFASAFALLHSTFIFISSIQTSKMKVALLTAAIVSAFAGATTLLRSWRNDRQARRQARRRPRGEQAADGASSLAVVLQDGGPRVQSEYDRDFARLGEIFGRGDGKFITLQSCKPAVVDSTSVQFLVYQMMYVSLHQLISAKR